MSFFNNISKIFIDQKIAEINAKINELNNFNFGIIKMGHYTFQTNQMDDTLDINYEGE